MAQKKKTPARSGNAERQKRYTTKKMRTHSRILTWVPKGYEDKFKVTRNRWLKRWDK